MQPLSHWHHIHANLQVDAENSTLKDLRSQAAKDKVPEKSKTCSSAIVL